MEFYPFLLVIHIIAAMLWLGAIPAVFILEKYFFGKSESEVNRQVLSAWLKIFNLSGMIGLTGILISGIGMVIMHPVFGFFEFSNNHWLASKQVITVILIVLTGAQVIPLGKKVRLALGADLSSNAALAADALQNLKKLAKLAKIMAALLSINFLFGVMYSVLRLF